ncbi:MULTISPECIES: AAA family ATPase [Parageobacillus]|uniref:AAA domain-containing protein n=1 Tax=Parageobacillus thermantarcticus TaxID=186116 RepID=A0A1I0TGZ0_9BACL|nr:MULTISPECIES: AAA family ATPase [Parageobacillus]MBY6268007.1 alpha/beta hydrolase [Parageobacillus thermoglucosidasius]OUM84923.1 MAG: alpha/beta hydrolase [Parageobacillus thermoglucosidasius]RDE19294.1 alpha/beta hydrolase [Parageobacillus thermoglucosidasius]SFA51024.1 AAA domain-containing protein [Parageobacillus thermantarcticus]
MGLLPKNQPKKTIDTPRNFFIWGQTMHGKSYLASQFPNPVVFNTDGNADQIETPSVNLKNERDPNTGKIKFSVIDQLNELIKELETTDHGFETVVIDVIDDVVTLIEQAICEEHGVQYIGDIPYGKGFGIFKSIFTALVVKLKALPMNVIYISRYATVTENNIEKPVPSLSVKHLNVVNGNCDMNILCQKIGKNYIRRVIDRRKAYQREWIQDKRILAILDTVIGAFDKPTQTSKEEAQKIVESLEKAEEQAIKAEATEQKDVQEAQEVKQAPKPRTAAPRPPRVK